MLSKCRIEALVDWNCRIWGNSSCYGSPVRFFIPQVRSMHCRLYRPRAIAEVTFMTRIVPLVICAAIVIAQGLLTNTLAQAPNTAGSHTEDNEQTTAVNKSDPNWQ